MSKVARFFCISSVWLGYLVSLTVVGTFAFPAMAKVSAVNPSTPKQERIMVFGDSLSAAYGINPAAGWVSLMAGQLKTRGVEVVNASISGETTSGGAARIKADLKNQKPTLVLLALGANDGLRGLPVAAMKKNLETIIVASRAAGARVVMIGIQIPPNYGIEYADSFRATYSALAVQYKLLLVPFLLDGIADKLELFQADRMHPAAIAQPRILKNVMPVVEQALKKQPQPTQKVKL